LFVHFLRPTSLPVKAIKAIGFRNSMVTVAKANCESFYYCRLEILEAF
jgi:hypothetical protein